MRVDDHDQELLFLNALASYADACVQPALTPSCPYFRHVDGAPTCGEECRGVLEANGVGDRAVRSLPVGGIVMTGRAIPIAAISGRDTFDSMGLFLRDRDLPVRDQSTASLLLNLRSEVFRNILTRTSRTTDALEAWGELTRRGVDMDRVFAGGVAPSMAASVTARVVIELLARDGLLSADDILGSGDLVVTHSWADIVLEALADTPPDPHLWRDAQFGPLFSVLGSESSFLDDEDILNSILKRPDIQYAISLTFTRRVIEWYVGLAGHDLESALRGDLPDANLFVALPGRETRQVGGLWIWERFTLTDTELWSASSLLQEWQWTRGGTTDICDKRVLAERSLSSDEVAEAAISAIDTEDDDATDFEMFSPSNYVQSAVNHLAAGDREKAAKIFEGIVELRPGDGEAWNNLGFCQLGLSADVALPMLRRGAALQRPTPVIFVANQVLALHLMDRDADALALAATSVAEASETDLSATVWLHPAHDGELELGRAASPREYLEALVAHIGEGACDSRGYDQPPAPLGIT